MTLFVLSVVLTTAGLFTLFVASTPFKSDETTLGSNTSDARTKTTYFAAM